LLLDTPENTEINIQKKSKYSLGDILLCPRCSSRIKEYADIIECLSCHSAYPIVDNIVIFNLVESEIEQSYANSYEKLANDDLQHSLVANRETYHKPFLKFLGNLKGKKILDIGSSNALYLKQIECDFRACVDIALPFLKDIPNGAVDLKICGDAEKVKFVNGFFDVVIAADVLEHLLNPRALLDNIYLALNKNGKLFTHVPWREDLSVYKDSPYEYTHLRSFNDYNFTMLTSNFEIIRNRYSYPKLDIPIFHVISEKLPVKLSRLVKKLYFFGKVAKYEYKIRERWINNLPENEEFLLRFYPPLFRTSELRIKRDPRSFNKLVFKIIGTLLEKFMKSKAIQ
jgi:SAM-dependent methyltransferase